MINKLTRLL